MSKVFQGENWTSSYMRKVESNFNLNFDFFLYLQLPLSEYILIYGHNQREFLTLPKKKLTQGFFQQIFQHESS